MTENTAAPVVDYPSTTALIAYMARELSPLLEGMPTEQVKDLAARSMVDSARQARTRSGRWAQESTSRQIEDALFQGSVAADVLAGDVSRPSVGNVRAHTLALANA